MLPVEIVLIVIGVICICVSFFISKKKGDDDTLDAAKSADIWTEKDEEVIIKHIDEILEERGMELVETTEDQMNRICNEKIMAIDEFSKPLLDKIHVNHEEVVFMYNMLGEKQKQIQDELMKDTLDKKVPNISKVEKAPDEELIDNTAKEQTTKVEDKPTPPPINLPIVESTTGLEQAKKERLPEFPVSDMSSTEVSTGKPIAPDTKVGDTPANEVGARRTVFTAQQYGSEEKQDGLPLAEGVHVETVKSNKSTAINTPALSPTVMQTAKAQSKAEPKAPVTAATVTTETESESIKAEDQMKRPSREFVMQHMEETASNGRGVAVEDQIRALYKQGKSVVDISKTLGIGQGEVKLMIAMYKKRGM